MTVEVKNLSFSYGREPVLRDISFSAKEGEFLSVLGPNGVGKSTLFRCMLGLLKPDSGKVFANGLDVSQLTAPQLARQMAYIPQSHSPVFNFTVLDMVLMGTTPRLGRFSTPGEKETALARQLLRRLGIEHLTDRGYRNISGGERQLVLIARAMAQQAKILIMDEPSASLDFGNRVLVMNALRELAKEGYCVIQSTHDPDQAYRYCDKILALQNGKVLSWGTPDEILRSDLISQLYGTKIKVCTLREGGIRVCIPGDMI